MELDVMWPELKLWFGNGDGTGCDVVRAETVVWEWRWDWMRCGLSWNCGFGMEIGLDEMWPDLKLLFGNGDVILYLNEAIIGLFIRWSDISGQP